MQLASIYANSFLVGCGSDVLLKDPGCHRNDVVALPVLNQAKGFKSLHNIVCPDGCQLSYFLDRQMSPVLTKQIQQHPCPVAAVTNLQADQMTCLRGAEGNL